MKIARAQFEWICLVARALLLIVILPALNATPAMVHGAPNFWHVGNFTLNLWGKYLCYAVLRAGRRPALGEHRVAFAWPGALLCARRRHAGMHLMLLAGPLGQYAARGTIRTACPTSWCSSGIPSAVVLENRLRHRSLPLPWCCSFPRSSLCCLDTSRFAHGFGAVYFSILTQALTYGAALMFFRNDLLMGGNNGFTDFRNLFGYDLRSTVTQRGLFICSAILLCAVYLFNRWLATTKFGLVQRAIRDGETRACFPDTPPRTTNYSRSCSARSSRAWPGHFTSRRSESSTQAR
jgi:hypothetical protein